MASADDLLIRLEELLAELDRLPEPAHAYVFEFLEGLDTLHRAAVHALADDIDDAELARIAAARPPVSWLLMAYGVAVDQRPEAEAALAAVRREVAAYGGTLEVVEAREGVVRVRLGGAAAADSRAMSTRSIEDALRRHMPSFDRVEFDTGERAGAPPSGGLALPIHHVTPRREDG